MIGYVVYWFEWFLIIWLGLLSFLVAKSLFKPTAPRKGLLYGNGTGFINAERVPLFLVTIGFAFYYTIQTLTLPLSELSHPDNGYWMPEVPEEFLYILFGAQASFLTGKIFRVFQLNGGRQ